jgi:hypothetical protein
MNFSQGERFALRQGAKIMRIIGVLSLLVLVAGCSVNKTPVATGGSKADATVRMSYEESMFESPQVNWAAAQREALARCEAWGYSSVEGFSGIETNCNAYNGYGNCISATHTRTYQCLD